MNVFKVKAIKEIRIFKEQDGEKILWDRLDKGKVYIVFANNLNEAKSEFKLEKGLKSCSNLEFAKVLFKDGFETIHGDDMVYVFYNGEKVYEWNDAAHYNYPEDLTWSRTISDVFYSGFYLGVELNNKLRNEEF